MQCRRGEAKMPAFAGIFGSEILLLQDYGFAMTYARVLGPKYPTDGVMP